MEKSKCNPTAQEKEFVQVVGLQIKGACEKLKEETNATDKHINKMLIEMATRYYSSEQ